jgi:protocatechuate 3,4-dioxygenase beta subunit
MVVARGYLFGVLSVLLFAWLLAATATAAPAAATGAVTGRVLDANGRGIAGADVTIMEAPADSGEGDSKERKRPQKLGSGKTDNSGVYRIDRIAVGKIQVVAQVIAPGVRQTAIAAKDGVSAYEVTAGKITKVDDIKMGAKAGGGK